MTTSQIGCMSRKYTNSDESSIASARGEHGEHADDQRQLEPGEHRPHPESSAKMNTTTRFNPRLNIASSTTESGITIRGKLDLANQRLVVDHARTAPPVASAKNVNSTIEPSSWAP